MKIKQLLKSNNGSSTVLVILIMVTLIVFGTLAMMSSYADLKLAKKSGSWNQTYYQLDNKAEEIVAKIDSSLINADKDALAYVKKLEFNNSPSESRTLVPGEMQSKIKAGWSAAMGDPASEKAYLDNVYRKLYFYLAVKNLDQKLSDEGLKLDYDTGLLEPGLFETGKYIASEQVLLASARLFVQSQAGKDENTQYLDLKLEVQCPGSYTAAASVPRIKVLSWKQEQQQFEFDNTIELWNGEVK